MISITLSNEGAIVAAAAAVACAMRYWQLRTAELNKAKDVGNQFKAAKTLSLKDMIVIDMLNQISNKCCFVLSDPDLPDNPLIYASNAFCKFTGYASSEIVNRNCRFLQGKDTDKNDTAKISKAIKDRTELSVCLKNYKKNGEAFYNQFFICPVYDNNKKLAYYLGVQAEVEGIATGQQPENPGWVFRMGSHE